MKRDDIKMVNNSSKKLIKVYEDGLFKEYDVKIDRKKLERIQQEIIYNCSFIIHKKDEFPFGFGPRFQSEEYKILNVNCGDYAFTRDGRDGPDVDYYTYTYDEYYFPEIVNIINEILEGNISKIEDLFETSNMIYDVNHYEDIKSLKGVKSLIDEYIKTNDQSILDSISSTINNYKHLDAEKPSKNVQDYFSELYECFEFINVREQNTTDIDKVKEMFGDNWREKLEGILKMSLHPSSDMDSSFVKRFVRK